MNSKTAVSMLGTVQSSQLHYVILFFLFMSTLLVCALNH